MIEKTLGGSLRRLREQQGVSLRGLAEKADVSPSLLSQIENGQCSPSISSMERIVNALGLTLGQFFVSSSNQNVNIIRAGDRNEVQLEWSRAQIASLGGIVNGTDLQVSMLSIKAGGLTGKHPTPSISDELAVVFDGKAILHLDRDEHLLERGDAVRILAGTLRQWRNETESNVDILVISLRPSSYLGFVQ